MENKESFVQLYTRLYNENYKELERLRKKEKSIFVKLILIIIGFVITIPIFPPFGTIVFIFILVPAIRNKSNKDLVTPGILHGEKSYRSRFKEKIISHVISHVFPDSEYTPFSGIAPIDYNKGCWEGYDRFRSEDKIITNISIKANTEKNLQLKIAEVHTESESTDDEGNTRYTTVFYGLAGSVNLPKDVGCYLRVEKNGLKLFGGPKDRVEMDVSEFEKIFDVKTDDRIKAMQILTADIMTELIELVKTSKVKFEFYINHDIMHIRFHTGAMFEPSVFSDSMQVERLRKCFEKIETVKNVTEHICNVINEVEI